MNESFPRRGVCVYKTSNVGYLRNVAPGKVKLWKTQVGRYVDSLGHRGPEPFCIKVVQHIVEKYTFSVVQ